MKKLSLIAITLMWVSLLMAQPNSASVFEDVTDTPVNGGLIAMLAVGMAYGFRKLYRKTNP